MRTAGKLTNVLGNAKPGEDITEEVNAAIAPEGETYWNGEPTPARKVRVVVGESPVVTWWCANLQGQERNAVEVTYQGDVFYLDNEDGTGWRKVTEGLGAPDWGHKSLPVERVISEISA